MRVNLVSFMKGKGCGLCGVIGVRGYSYLPLHVRGAPAQEPVLYYLAQFGVYVWICRRHDMCGISVPAGRGCRG